MKGSKIVLILLMCFVWQSFVSAGLLKKRRKKSAPPKISKPSPSKPSGILADENPYKQCKADVLPSFINSSLGWRIHTNAVFRSFKALSPPSVVVTSAGNSHPLPVPEIKNKASKDFNAIVVGSLRSSGGKSGFSQEGEAVHIMAPSDYYQTSVHDDGSYKRFGGTSGAAPLVTAGLSGFEWLSGYHPTAAEAKILLEKTAILTLSSNQKPRKNGFGMLNSYKLGMVGKELKRLCGRSVSCFRKMIQNPAVYRFPTDPNLLSAVNEAFPGCGRACGAGISDSCTNKEAVFKRLRKASFLNPQDKKLWTALACVYSEAGFTEDAQAMLNTYKALFGPFQNGKPAHGVCRSDSDCVLVPRCVQKSNIPAGQSESSKSMPSLSPVRVSGSSQAPIMRFEPAVLAQEPYAMTRAEAEIHYATSPCRQGLCNGKCRCSKTEPLSSDTVVSAKCINSQCILSTTESAKTLPQTPIAPLQEANPSGGSGQR